jgi:hypothetical protein
VRTPGVGSTRAVVRAHQDLLGLQGVNHRGFSSHMVSWAPCFVFCCAVLCCGAGALSLLLARARCTVFPCSLLSCSLLSCSLLGLLSYRVAAAPARARLAIVAGCCAAVMVLPPQLMKQLFQQHSVFIQI